MGTPPVFSKMKVLCLWALLAAVVSSGPVPGKHDAELAEFGFTDTLMDALKGKILDVIKGQLTEENVEKITDAIKERLDGGDWADTVIDFLGDLVTQDVLDTIIEFIEDKLLGGHATYGIKDSAKDFLAKIMGKILDMLPLD